MNLDRGARWAPVTSRLHTLERSSTGPRLRARPE